MGFLENLKKRQQEAGTLREEKRQKKLGHPVWVIKCPAPDHERKVKWGDYSFAKALKKYLERLGAYVVIDLHEHWEDAHAADVVLVLRGLYAYEPKQKLKNCRYYMWNISHPDMISDQEYEWYDHVFIGSAHYAHELEKRLSVPVSVLQQCTDAEIFTPEGEHYAPCEGAYLFIGNSRGVVRNSVLWSINAGVSPYIVGGGWKKIIPKHMDLVREQSVENDLIPAYYRAAKVTMNDHWDDMLQLQFVNNRIFDAVACGLPVITDVCDELREIFPTGLLYYENEEEFRACVREIEENYEEVKAKTLALRPLVCEKYSFAARAEELMQIYKRETE
ncbi:MAG: glycosyltransferase [Eubacteriales bacterium]|nr:glycosyltransferase [Eubacteriales bacterium]